MRYSQFPCAVIAVLGTVSCKAPPPPGYSIEYAEKRAVLPNGLRLVIIPDKTTPLFKLPGDYYDQLIKRVAALSTAQVKALLGAELRPETEIVGCVADRDTLTRAFTEAGLASPRYIEID